MRNFGAIVVVKKILYVLVVIVLLYVSYFAIRSYLNLAVGEQVPGIILKVREEKRLYKSDSRYVTVGYVHNNNSYLVEFKTSPTNNGSIGDSVTLSCDASNNFYTTLFAVHSLDISFVDSVCFFGACHNLVERPVYINLLQEPIELKLIAPNSQFFIPIDPTKDGQICFASKGCRTKVMVVEGNPQALGTYLELDLEFIHGNGSDTTHFAFSSDAGNWIKVK